MTFLTEPAASDEAGLGSQANDRSEASAVTDSKVDDKEISDKAENVTAGAADEKQQTEKPCKR